LRRGIRAVYADPAARAKLTLLFEDLVLTTRQIGMAEDYVRELLSKKPGDPDALAFKVKTLLQADRDDEAKELLDQVRAKFPTHHKTWQLQLKLGASQWKWPQSRLSKALDEYLTKNPESVEALAWVAQLNVILESGDPRAAERLANKALRIDPTCADASVVQAMLALRRGRTRQALDTLKTILATDPAHLDALGMLGVLEHNQGNLGRAELAIRAVLRVDPFRSNAIEGLVLILLKKRRVREAIRNSQRYLEFCRLTHNPPAPTLLILNLEALEKVGREQEALAQIEGVAERHGEEFPAFDVVVARAYFQLGRLIEAKTKLNSVLEAHPKLRSALDLQDQLDR
jgi:tetratricopeptide (TPR) repeat protein